MIGNRDLLVYRTKGSHLSMQFNHCGIQECTPGYRYGFHVRPYQLIHFVLEGSGELELPDKTYTVHAGQAFYIPTGSSGFYRASTANPWKYAWIGFYADSRSIFLQSLLGDNRVIDITLPLEELEALILSVIAVTDSRADGLRTYRRTQFPGPQFQAITTAEKSLEVNSRMLHLFSRLLEVQTLPETSLPKERNYAADAKAFINSCYCEPLKIRDVADALHIHPNYLSSVFRKAYGQTPKEYLDALRMERAAQLLVLSDDSVAVVSASVGYENPFQFSAAFKRHFNMSPAHYRKEEK